MDIIVVQKHHINVAASHLVQVQKTQPRVRPSVQHATYVFKMLTIANVMLCVGHAGIRW